MGLSDVEGASKADPHDDDAATCPFAGPAAAICGGADRRATAHFPGHPQQALAAQGVETFCDEFAKRSLTLRGAPAYTPLIETAAAPRPTGPVGGELDQQALLVRFKLAPPLLDKIARLAT